MPTVNVNFTTVLGFNSVTTLLGAPTSVAISSRETAPLTSGKLGWLSLRIGGTAGIEQFGFSNWYGGRAIFTPASNTGLRAVFIARRAGLLLTLTYVYP